MWVLLQRHTRLRGATDLAMALAVSSLSHEGDEEDSAEGPEGRQVRRLLTTPEGTGNTWLRHDG